MTLELTSEGLLVLDRGPDKDGNQTKSLRLSDTVITNGEQHLVSYDQMDRSLPLELPDRLNCRQPFEFKLDLFGIDEDDITAGKTTVQDDLQSLPKALGVQRKSQLWKLVEQNGIETVRLQRQGNLEEEEYLLMYRQALIGSSQSSCPICLDDDSVAPVAARLLWLDRSFWLQNLGEADRVQIDGQSIEPGETVALQTGMRLRFGQTIVQFERAKQMHL